MSMSPAMLAALKARNPVLVHLLKIELPGRTIRLVDGSGFILWNGESYHGEDPEFGKIAGFGELAEAEGTEAPRQSIQLMPKGNGGLAALTSPGAQGSPVTIYAAVVDRQTGQVVGAPDPRFIGELDEASFKHERNSTLLELDVASIWERLFDDNEGHRWNDAFWTYLYGSNARAFAHVTNASRKLYWGFNGPPANGSGGSSYGGSGSVGGGGGGSLIDSYVF